MPWQVIDVLSLRLPDDEEPARAWRPADHENALLLFFPTEVQEGVKTSYGEADAVLCEKIVNLDSGEVFVGPLVYGSVLTVNIKPGIPDGQVLGRLGKGVARGGNSAPWLLFKHDEADRDRAEAWMKENL